MNFGSKKADGPDESPDFLVREPKRGDGVRRLNRLPLVIVGCLGGVSALALGLAAQQRAAKQHETPKPGKDEAAAAQTVSGGRPDFLTAAPVAGVVPDHDPAKVLVAPMDPNAAPPELVRSAQATAPGPAPAGAAQPSPGQAPPRYADQWRQYDERSVELQRIKYEQARTAMSAPTAVAIGDKDKGGQPPAQASSPLAALTAALAAQTAGSGAGVPPGPPAPIDPNGQASKASFLTASGGKPDYLTSKREAALASNELKAGTVIPAVMIGGVNSDLPGEIVGQVTRNVYDTVSGKMVLVPQGAKLVGQYDSHVTMGQARVLVAWKRIIYPDGSSLDLGVMPGVDQGGYAGFKDQVNNHYARTFGSALMVSLFSAGVQLSQPQATNGQNISSGQTVASALGQQLGELGMEVARRNLQVQPTLQIRPGYRFEILLTKDVVIRPWTPRS